jgi:hypothetical protein
MGLFEYLSNYVNKYVHVKHVDTQLLAIYLNLNTAELKSMYNILVLLFQDFLLCVDPAGSQSCIRAVPTILIQIVELAGFCHFQKNAHVSQLAIIYILKNNSYSSF